jgi:hypothetical protein
LPEAKGEVEIEVCVKIRVFQFIKCVVHTRKRVSVLTRSLVKATVVNALT